MVAIARSSTCRRIQQALLATVHHLGVDIQSAPTLLAQMHLGIALARHPNVQILDPKFACFTGCKDATAR